ncbi:MAG TPA: hypothetical protein VNQ77_11590 [Frankiaceae bacterium]|nr:hypothetical protein [Frankiaceae bacterium]
MRRAARTVAVVALLAAAAPFARADAAPTLRWRLWRVTRIDATARPVGMDVAVTASAPGALSLIVGVRGTGTSRRVTTSLFWEDGGTGRAVYRDGATTPVCHGGTCPADDAGIVQFRVGNDQTIRDEFLILTLGASARTTFDRPGWRVREVAAPRVRRVMAVAARGTGVTTGSAAAELYEGASASGSARGSIAWASVPCDGGGLGEAALTTMPALAGSSQSLTCSGGETEGAAIASRSVKWTVAGRVFGVAHEAPATRLLVLDL